MIETRLVAVREILPPLAAVVALLLLAVAFSLMAAFIYIALLLKLMDGTTAVELVIPSVVKLRGWFTTI